MDQKREKGVTLIALAITIVVLLIIAGISIKGGTSAIKMAQLEELKTNMLLIQAKGRQYVEDVNFKIGIEPDKKTTEEKADIRRQVYEEEAKLRKAEDVPANFGITDLSVEVYNTIGYDENYSLTDIDKIQE